MAYKKFDDPALGTDESVQKVNTAYGLQADSIRRALQSISNRILWGAGTDGYNSTAWSPNCGSANSGTGAAIGKALFVLVNGVAGTRSSCGTINHPTGTQSKNTFVKYLLAGAAGSSGTMIAGNESGSAAGALLPDCPDGLIAFGYMQFATTSGTAWNRTTGLVTTSVAAAQGTATFVDFFHMPYSG